MLKDILLVLAGAVLSFIFSIVANRLDNPVSKYLETRSLRIGGKRRDKALKEYHFLVAMKRPENDRYMYFLGAGFTSIVAMIMGWGFVIIGALALFHYAAIPDGWTVVWWSSDFFARCESVLAIIVGGVVIFLGCFLYDRISTRMLRLVEFPKYVDKLRKKFGEDFDTR